MNQVNQALQTRYNQATTEYVRTQIVGQMIQEIDALQSKVGELESETPTPIPFGVSLTAQGTVTLQDGYGIVVPNLYTTIGTLSIGKNSIFAVI